MQELKAKPCEQCKATFTCRVDRDHKLCCICSTNVNVMRQYMEDAKSFQLNVGVHKLRPRYYLEYNSDVLGVGSIVAYRHLTGIRIGMISANFISDKYVWIKSIARMGESVCTETDEIGWHAILCILKQNAS